MIIVMSRQGALTVGEASLPRQSGEGSPSHSVAPCEFLDLWVKTIAFAIRSVDRWVTLHVFKDSRRTEIGTKLDVGPHMELPA